MNDVKTDDLQARRRIQEDLNANFFVEASAGSGKTTALVDRMVAMVESGIEVGKICAITFTVAASRELYDRFLNKLMERQNNQNLATPIKERINTAVENIDLCFIGTIDAFCNQLLKEHPTRAHVPSTVSLVEEGKLNVLYRREYARLKRGKYPKLQNLYRKFCAVHSNPDIVFKECIGAFMAAHAALWVLPEAPEDWRLSCGIQLEQLRAALETIKTKPEYVSQSNDKGRKAFKALPNAIRALRDYQNDGSFADLFSALKAVSASDNDNMQGLMLTCEPGELGIDDASLFELRGKNKTVYCLALFREGGLLSQLQEYQYALTVRFLSKFAAEMAKALKSNGELSFYDSLLYLRNMLQEDAKNRGRLAGHIRERHSWFLIDEFQDTDPLQAEVFFLLTSQEPVTDWWKARPAPGSLFIVGDPKQSIYRFRGADVKAYLKVKKLFASPVGETLHLRQNFRSNRSLCAWFNNAFKSLLPEETSSQSKFEEIPLEENAEDTGKISGAFCYPTTDNGNAEDVAGIINRIVNNPDVMIQTRKDASPRAVEYRDVMVITRTTTNLKKYIDVMRAQGIPFRVEGVTSFEACPALVAMTNFMAAFADPLNRASVYRALRSWPFTLEEIIAWKNEGRRLSLFGHEKEENPVSEALTQLDEFRRRHVMTPPSALCRAVLQEFELFQRCGVDHMEHVWQAIELLRSNASDEGNFSLTEASKFLDRLTSGTGNVKRTLDLNEDQNRVRLANLHKVKGLEAPVVILAQLKQSNHEPSIHMETEDSSQKRWALKLEGRNFNSPVYAETTRFKNELTNEKENQKAEEARLLYVAATRAEHVLLIPRTCGDKNLWSSLDIPGTKDINTILNAPPAGKPNPNPDQDSRERDEMVEENPLLYRDVEQPTWRLHLPSNLHDSDQEPSKSQEPDAAVSLPRGQTSSLQLGTVVHRAMEMLVSSRAKLADSAIIAAIREEYSLENSAEATEAVSILGNTLETIRHGGWEQETGVPADILTEALSADEAYCEVPFCMMHDGAMTSGVMDLVYRKGSSWYVVDYKTNADPYGLDQLYHEQLAAYRDAINRLFGVEDAAIHVYHIPLLKS